MSKEAMTLALEEFKHIKQWCLRSIGIGLVNENVLAALEEALAKQNQCEPVEWVDLTEEEFVYFCSYVTCDILLEIEAKLKEKNT